MTSRQLADVADVGTGTQRAHQAHVTKTLNNLTGELSGSELQEMVEDIKWLVDRCEPSDPSSKRAA